jgi:hypothetical protein
MNDMQSVLEYLLKFGCENNVFPSIRFEGDIGCGWIFVNLRRGHRCIERMLYYVPCGDKTVDNFRLYNPRVDVVLQIMLDKLNEKEVDE